MWPPTQSSIHIRLYCIKCQRCTLQHLQAPGIINVTSCAIIFKFMSVRTSTCMLLLNSVAIKLFTKLISKVQLKVTCSSYCSSSYCSSSLMNMFMYSPKKHDFFVHNMQYTIVTVINKQLIIIVLFSSHACMLYIAFNCDL